MSLQNYVLTGLVWRWALRRGLCAETWTSSGNQPGGGKGRAFSEGRALQSPRGGRELEDSPRDGGTEPGERGRAEIRERGRGFVLDPELSGLDA